MKRTIKLAVVAALALGATSAFATNGSTMIGMGAKARGMGGTGIGVGHGAESALSNPALITTIKADNEVSFGGTVFMPDVENTNDLTGGPTTSDSNSDFFVIPSVSLASKINDNWYWGIGMWGTGGLGVDYRTDTVTQMGMVTSLQNMQFGVPIAYTTDGLSIGVTPIVQYTSLDVSYKNPLNANAIVGAGVSQSLGLGYNIGLAYEMDGITFGATYISSIENDIQDVLSTAVGGMGVTYNQKTIETPAQMGVGVSYTTEGHTLAVDYKNINWEDADVYKDFGWEDQDVIAIGYEYATDGWAVRCGYQYADSAVQDNSGKNLALDTAFLAANAGYSPNLTNTFNQLGFPGNMETHVTLGATYVVNDKLSIDIAAVYGLEETTTTTNFANEDISVDHSEESYSFQVNYAF